jgi:DNA-binding winged helix-turn-helix (wHTH) protein
MDTGFRPAQLQRHTESMGIGVNFTSRYARFGVFDLDLQKQELFQNGSRVKLQGKVSQALLTLLEKPGEIVTREELRTRLWPADGRINYDANVNTTVNKLRLVLGDSTEQPLYVETIPRMGYSFIAKVEYRDQAPVRENRSAAKEVAAGTENRFAKLAHGWKASFLRVASPSTWLTAGVIALVIAGMLLGGAMVIFSFRTV